MQVSKSKGFTLIELLVVIAIIAILAAILFPVFAQAREKARAASAQSNQKQVTLALLMYVQDYDEKFPQFYYPRWPGDPQSGMPNEPEGIWEDHNLGWDEVVLPYIKNVQVFKDPDFDDGNDATNPQKDDSDWTGSTNFCFNAYMSGRCEGFASCSTAKLASLEFPASTILLGESGRNTSTGSTCGLDGIEWGWTSDHKNRLVWPDGTDESNQQPALQIHTGGAEYAFSDGHVKWMRGSSTGLLSNGTATDQSVDPIMGRHDGSVPTYCIGTSQCATFAP